MAAIVNNKVILSAQTAAFSFNVPANYVIDKIVVENTTANAITGGLKVGTTSGAVDIVAALAVGANAKVVAGDAILLKQFFSSAAAQTIFVDAVTVWNSASITMTIILAPLTI